MARKDLGGITTPVAVRDRLQELAVENRIYVNVNDVIRALNEIKNEPWRFTGNNQLGRAAFRILSAMGLGEDWESYISNPKEVLKVIELAINEERFDNKTPISEITERHNRALAEEEAKPVEVSESKQPTNLKELVAEYEAYLAKNEDKPERAIDRLVDRYGQDDSVLSQFIAKQREFYWDNLEKLQRAGVEESQAKVIAEKVACEEVLVADGAKNSGYGEGVADRVAQTMGDRTIEAVVGGKGETITSAPKKASGLVAAELGQVLPTYKSERIHGEIPGRTEKDTTDTVVKVETPTSGEEVTKKLVNKLLGIIPGAETRTERTTVSDVADINARLEKKVRQMAERAVREEDVTAEVVVAEIGSIVEPGQLPTVGEVERVLNEARKQTEEIGRGSFGETTITRVEEVVAELLVDTKLAEVTQELMVDLAEANRQSGVEAVTKIDKNLVDIKSQQERLKEIVEMVADRVAAGEMVKAEEVVGQIHKLSQVDISEHDDVVMGILAEVMETSKTPDAGIERVVEEIVRQSPDLNRDEVKNIVREAVAGGKLIENQAIVRIENISENVLRENDIKGAIDEIREIGISGLSEENREKRISEVAENLTRNLPEKERQEVLGEIDKVVKEKPATAKIEEKTGVKLEPDTVSVVEEMRKSGEQKGVETKDDKVARIVNRLVEALPPEAFPEKLSEKQQELKQIIKDAMGKAIADGDLSPKAIVAWVRQKNGTDLSPFEAKIEIAMDKVRQMMEANPWAVAVFIDNKVKNDLVAELMRLNPSLPIKKAEAYAEAVTKIFSAFYNPINVLGEEKAVDGAISEAQKINDPNRATRSKEELKMAFLKFSAVSGLFGLSKEEAEELKKNFIETGAIIHPPNNGRARALKEACDLFEKLDPRLHLLLKKLQSSRVGQKMNGVITVGGVKQLQEGIGGFGFVKAIKGSGWFGKLMGAKNSALGQAVLAIAQNGFSLETVESMAIGYLWKRGVVGAIKMVGKKAAASAIGKVVIKVGIKILAKLGISVGLQAAPVIGQIVTALMWLPEIIGLVKLPFKAVGNVLNKLGINFFDDAKKILSDIGIQKLPDVLLLGAITIVGGILAIPAMFAMATLPLVPLLGSSLIGFSLFSTLQNTFYSALVPAREIVPGPHGTNFTSMLGPQPTVDISNMTITPGCPSKVFWPVNGPITQGPCGGHSHIKPGYTQAIDFGVPFGTEIRATHNGVAIWGQPSSTSTGYGCYIDIVGVCDGITYRTRYGHMPCETNEPGKVAIAIPKQGVKIVSGIGRLVANGAQVKQGDVIGWVDSTGNSTGNHLHYELVGEGKMFRINTWVPSPGVYDLCTY